MVDPALFSEIQDSPYLSNAEKHHFISQLVQNGIDSAQPVLTNHFLWFWTLGGFALFVLCLAVRYAIDMSAIRTGQYASLQMSRGGYAPGPVFIINAATVPASLPPTSPAYYRPPVIDCDRVHGSVFK